MPDCPYCNGTGKVLMVSGRPLSGYRPCPCTLASSVIGDRMGNCGKCGKPVRLPRPYASLLCAECVGSLMAEADQERGQPHA
jgi:hypothetical protein